MSPFPATTRALELFAYDGKPESLRLIERPIPKPGNSQVLVKIAAAPVNPSDLMFLRGTYARQKKLPIVPGFEASGVVVESGGGLGRALVGRRVACGATDDGDGTWAEYMATHWNRCVPLRDNVTLEQGASLLVNPLTAFALMDIAKRGGHRTIVQTAAASALGRMINNLGRRFGIEVVNIVRRNDQVVLLKSQGAKFALNSSDSAFAEHLKNLCTELRVRLAFDAVGGPLTEVVLNALDCGGRVLVYGALAGECSTIDPHEILFEDKCIEGFWLAHWFPRQNLFYQLATAYRAQGLIDQDLRTEIRARISLEQASDALQDYESRMTEGKILLIPNANE